MSRTSPDTIDLMKNFMLELEASHNLIHDAWVDDWDDYNGFSFGIRVYNHRLNRYSTNSVKAAIRHVLNQPKYEDIRVDMVNYNAPRYLSYPDYYDPSYWMFNAQVT